jgi:hypothetical protein
VISLNSGGGTEVVVTSDRYLEGFFFGGTEEAVVTPLGGGGIVGGGGGGGGIPGTNILVTPSWDTSVGISLQVNTTVDKTITVKNLGTTSVTVILTHNFGDHLQILGGDNTLTIPAYGIRDFNIRFVAGISPDTIAGIISISDKTVLTSLDISTELLLFDSNIVVLNKGLEVTQGGQLKTLVTLIPLGDSKRLDVTLNFVIKNYANKIYLTKSETLLITNLTQVTRNFDTGLLLPGDYVIGLTLVYPSGIAPSSAHFKVVGKSVMSFFGKVVLFLIILILIIAIVIIIILIWRRRKKKEGQEKS